MSRAIQISEDIKRMSGGAWYRCLNGDCQHMEYSPGMTPKDVMNGHGTACSQCGSKSEAVWGSTSLPGHMAQPSSRTRT